MSESKDRIAGQLTNQIRTAWCHDVQIFAQKESTLAAKFGTHVYSYTVLRCEEDCSGRVRKGLHGESDYEL